jgi:hypothetical protein
MAKRSTFWKPWNAMVVLMGSLGTGSVCLGEPPSSPSTGWRGGVLFFYGQKALGAHDWQPVEYQDAVGSQITAGPVRWPVAFALDHVRSYENSSEDGERFKGKTEEWCMGIRKVWESGFRRTYVGGGAGFLQAKLTLPESGRSDSDSSFGPWMGGGVFWRAGEYFSLGFFGRYSWGRVTIFDESRQAGGPQAGFLVGWGWPGSP